MKIWIYLNGVQQGPYTFDELRSLPVEPTTPVWYDGLPEWTAAGEVPATMPLFATPTAPPAPAAGGCGTNAYGVWTAGEPVPQPQPAEWQAAQPQSSQWQPAQSMPPRPNTYLVWSILVTLLCCNPVSIAAIITGAITNSRYNSGNYAGAERMSSVTEWLVILAILFGVLALPLTLILTLL